MRETLSLMGIYIVIVAVLQVCNGFISYGVEKVAPAASLFVFLGLFVSVFAFAWPIAVRISHRLMPETDEERRIADLNTLAHITRTLRPRPF